DSTTPRGATAASMGNALTPSLIGGGYVVTLVALGSHFTCAVLNTNTLKCWGQGSEGQLGNGQTQDVGRSSGEMATVAPITIPNGTGGVFGMYALAAGDHHACVAFDDGQLGCWG